MRALDLFAGPGGWDLAAEQLGVTPVGIEHDKITCETREAAGLATIRGDVSIENPYDYAPVDQLLTPR